MAADDVELHSLPLYHCAQLDNFLITDIYLGATSIILPAPGARSWSCAPSSETEVTNFFAPPTVWISLLRSPGLRPGATCPACARATTAPRRCRSRFSHEMRERLPGPAAVELLRPDRDGAARHPPSDPTSRTRHAGSAGRPCINVETAILDDDDTPVPAGVVGEIAHRSPHLMLGYLDDPEKTAEAFRGGWFHSGDLGYYDEHGLLHVVDRKKDMIKTGGENVASREVEEALYRHRRRRGGRRLRPAPPGLGRGCRRRRRAPCRRRRSAEDDVIAHCREHLAGFKTPKRVFFADSLPKNPSGKLLKRILRDRFSLEQLWS